MQKKEIPYHIRAKEKWDACYEELLIKEASDEHEISNN